jgi:hypothetical protein
MKIEARQHIYASVRETESPRRRGGYQTVFYTQHDLRAETVEEIERRMAYFAGEGATPKRLFFPVGSGGQVLSQITPVPDVDEFGRGGLYLAHSLIFSVEDAQQLGVRLLQLFREKYFVTSIQEAVERGGDLSTGNIPLCEVDVPETRCAQEEVPAWVQSNWKILLRYVLRAEDMEKEGKRLALVGSPEEIFDTLFHSLRSVPSELVRLCSFDTFFDAERSSPARSPYFLAVGVREAPASSRFIPMLVSEDSNQPEKPPVEEAIPSPRLIYLRWAEATRFDAVEKDKDLAYALCRWLWSYSPYTAPLQDPERHRAVIEGIFRQEPAAQRVEQILKELCGEQVQVEDNGEKEMICQLLTTYFAQKSSPVLRYQCLKEGTKKHMRTAIEQIVQLPLTDRGKCQKIILYGMKNKYVDKSNFAKVMRNAVENGLLDDKGWQECLKEGIKRRLLSVKDFADLMLQAMRNKVIKRAVFIACMTAGVPKKLVNAETFGSLMLKALDMDYFSGASDRFVSLVRLAIENGSMDNQAFCSIMDSALDRSSVKSEFTPLMTLALSRGFLQLDCFGLLMKKAIDSRLINRNDFDNLMEVAKKELGRRLFGSA